jgi:hypothetical protein
MFVSMRLRAILLAALGLAGCPASAPVQDLSDTRQTIQAAEAAGAATLAPAPLARAHDELKQAELYLQQHHYHDASRAAEQAHKSATEALKTAQEASGTPPNPPN